MKIVISGGTGFIGSHLVRDLAKDGHQIFILSRSPQKSPDFPPNVRPVRWDAETMGDWVQSLDGADAVVNLAGENISGTGFFPSRWTDQRRKRIRQSRIKVGHALSEGIISVEHKPEVFVQASAVGYYGTRGSEVITEESQPGDDFMASVCKDWEESTGSIEGQGVRRVITRLGIVLSPESGALPRLVLPFKLYLGGPMGRGDQWYSWIHIDDVIAAMRFLIEEHGASGAFNLTAPNPVKNKTFAAVLGKVMSRPSYLPVPGLPFRLLFGDVASVILKGQRVLPSRLNDLRFEFHFPRLEIALQDLLQ